MSKFQVGDAVVAIQDTTGGSEEFQSWVKKAIATQTVLTIGHIDSRLCYFKEVDWCLYASDLIHFEPIQENE